MDKILIVSGLVLTYAAYSDTQGDVIKGVTTTVSQNGFIGSMVVMGGLLTLAQYHKPSEKYAAALAVIIALSFAGKYRKGLSNE